MNYFVKNKSLPQSSISRFINYDVYDEMIGDKALGILCDDIYVSCRNYIDLYDEYKKIS